MSVTSRTYDLQPIAPCTTKITGSVDGDKTTIQSIIFTDSSSFYLTHIKASQIEGQYATIDGTKYAWVVDSTFTETGIFAGTYVIKAHVNINNLVINKPWLDILNVKPGNIGEEDSGSGSSVADIYNFSFYDLGSHLDSLNAELSLNNNILDGKNTVSLTINGTDGFPFTDDCTLKIIYQYSEQGSISDTQYDWKTVDSIKPINKQLSRTDVPPVTLWNKITDKTRLKLQCTVVEYFGTTEYSRRTIYDNDVISLPDSAVPTISAVTLNDPAGLVPSSWKAYIQHISKVGISALTADGIYGSTIDKVELALSSSGISLASASGTTDSLPKTSTINNYGTFDVTVTVTDSRGRTASKSAQVTFLPYSAPYIQSILSQRCLKDGTLDNDGTYVRLSGDPVYSPCNGNNAYHVYVSWKRTDESTYNAETEITSFPAQIGDDDFDTEYSYDIRYRITDQFNTNHFVDYVSTAIMLMHFMREGKGVAFGQKATIQNCMDVAFNALFRQNVGFEVDGKFYTIEDIINAVNPTAHSTLTWVDGNTKDFS